MSFERLQVRVLGVVQGVGFRPFVHRLAHEHDLPGWVLNDGNGVTLEVEGHRADLLLFLSRLRREAPRASWIHAIDHRFLPPAYFADFEIRPSQDVGKPRVWVLPDLATCDKCRADVFDPENRRHGYAFTNCTNCGPRFTIIEGMPYDRPMTSMRAFEMCPRCRTEYETPTDRRFHAQPNACAVCGPRLSFLDKSGVEIEGDPMEIARNWLFGGRILGVKGLGGYHLVVDATNEAAVATLRERKQRPYKPFALMYPDIATLRRDVAVPSFAEPLLESAQAPILLLPRKGGSDVAPSVAPQSPSLGVFVAYTPLHQLLLAGVDQPVVATSANLSEQPMLFDDDDALEHLPHWCDGILVHDRRIVRPADDSVVQVLQRPTQTPQLLRRSRGYAPLPLLAPRELPCILALGGEMNATFAVSRGREIILSQHLGDLGSYEGQRNYRNVVRDFLRLHELEPELVVHDLHPDYFTTGLAAEYSDRWQVPISGVQHHHAHLAACVLENEIDGEVLGLCWDGTGFGTDRTVWGGEFLYGDASGFERVASLRSFGLPGGDACSREGWRVALSLLHEAFGADAPILDGITGEQHRVVRQMLERGVNAPISTSMGRLFDGVAALLGISFENKHQAQSPQLLESAAWQHGTDAEAFELPLVDGRLDWAPMIRSLVESEEPSERLAARFHHTLIEAAIRTIAGQSRPAVLAGGVFCNRYLTEGILVRAEEAGMPVYIHSQLPPTDGSLSAGQLWVGANRT
jgi:hydrogenase maturation protein HypF